MENTVERPRGSRAVAREAVRVEVAAHAIELFHQQGYDETTIDDICSSAGISTRSFFRYFSSKEEVVLGDVLRSGEALTAAVGSRPGSDDAWDLLRYGLHAILEHEVSGRAEHFLRAMTVICTSPALRAGYLQKHLAWTEALAPVLLDRTGDDRPLAAFNAHTVIHVAFACLDSALIEWVAQAGQRPLHDLLDQAFLAARPEHHGSPTPTDKHLTVHP